MTCGVKKTNPEYLLPCTHKYDKAVRYKTKYLQDASYIRLKRFDNRLYFTDIMDIQIRYLTTENLRKWTELMGGYRLI